MNDEIRLSRLRVSRRRALSIGGTISLSGLIAACGGGGNTSTGAATTPSTSTQATTTAPASSGDLVAALDDAPTCVLAGEEKQGPYWFDVDSIRRDIREDRPGTRLDLALRVQDMSECKAGGEAAPVADAVVEIWHCDAGGNYSGVVNSEAFEASPYDERTGRDTFNDGDSIFDETGLMAMSRDSDGYRGVINLGIET